LPRSLHRRRGMAARGRTAPHRLHERDRHRRPRGLRRDRGHGAARHRRAHARRGVPQGAALESGLLLARRAMTHGLLRERVFEANREIVRAGLVVLTFGNASGVDRESGVMAIKPSGVPYVALDPESMVLVDLETGTTI